MNQMSDLSPRGRKRGVGRRLRLCMCLLCFFCLNGWAVNYAQTLTLSLKDASLKEVFNWVERNSDYRFLYKSADVSGIRVGDVQVENVSVEALLDHCLANTGLVYERDADLIVVKEGEELPQSVEEPVHAKGTVVDEEGNPLPGVAVMIAGTMVGVTTDVNGNFEIVCPGSQSEVKLVFSFIGMKAQTVVYKGQDLKVTMVEEAIELGVANVVETGYQTIDRRHLTSSISSVKAEDILVPGMTSIDQALEGRIPGLVLMTNSGEVGATPRIRVRGTSTLIGNRQPLWVLDGVVLYDPVDVDPSDLNNPDYINIIGNAIAGINPQDIERIDVLKDASATALYGTQAANGVIVVTTKRGVAGRTSFSYSHTSKFTRRPRYTDRAINLMNSQERMQFGKDLVDSHYNFPQYMPMVGYEGAYYNWMSGQMSYEDFLKEVQHFETVNTDWFDILTRDAYSQTHNISMSGGTDKVRYYTSIGLSDDNGVTRTSYTDRYTLLMNLDANLSKKFTASLSINANIQHKNHVPTEVGAMDYAYNTTRALPCFNEDGSYYFYQVANDNNTYLNYNILNEIDNSAQEYNGSTIMASLNMRMNLTDWWNATVSASYSKSSTRQEDWWGEKSWHVASLRNAEEDQTPPTGEDGDCYLPYGGILSTTQSDATNMMLRIQSNISKYVDGDDQKHLIAASLGFEANSNNNTSIADETRGYLKDRGQQFVDISGTDNAPGQEAHYIIDDYPHFKDWLAEPHRRITENLTNKISGYLTLSYSYDDLFTLNLNGRFDASNKFGSESNNKLLPVWSVSGMANLREIFYRNRLADDYELQDRFWLTDARLRVSFGQQGNMIDGETPDMLLTQGGIDTWYGEYVSTLSKLPNPNLKWEVTNQTNIGLDLAFFSARLNVGLDFYLKKTHDLLSSINVSSVNGVPGGSYVMNNGNVSNTGFDISLSGYPIKKDDFSWYMSTYYSVNWNEVQTQPLENYTMATMLNGNAIISGKPISTFYSYKFLGLDPQTGIPLFDDWEDRVHLLYGKSVAEVMMTVLEESGCRDPFITGNLNNNVKWKNWNLSFNLAYSLGSKVRLFEMYDPIQNGVTPIENVRKEFTERWMVPGDEKRTNYPVLLSPNDPLYTKYIMHWSADANQGYRGLTGPFAQSIWQMYDNSNIRVVSGNYLKLQSLTLRYNLSPKVLKKTPFSYFAINFSTQNLFTISAKALKGQDPSQAGFDKPNLSVRPTYTLGLNVSF